MGNKAAESIMAINHCFLIFKNSLEIWTETLGSEQFQTLENYKEAGWPQLVQKKLREYISYGCKDATGDP